MNYYNYSGRKSQSRLKSNRKKVIINILIIVVVIALCVAFALILGNHLKNRLEEADISTQPVEEIIEPLETKEPDPADGIDFSKNDRAEGEMSAVFGYLDLAGCPDAAGAEAFVSNLKDAGYTGLIFNVKNEAGKIAYASAAVSELTRTEMPSNVVPSEYLISSVNRASSLGMRSAAYVRLGDMFASDETSRVVRNVELAVIKELSAMGFSEVILDGAFEGRELTADTAKLLYGYVSGLRNDCPGTDIGIVIDESFIADPEKTPALEIVFRYTDFFAIDFRNTDDPAPEKIADALDKYSGSFNAYSICALVKGQDVNEIRSSYALFALKEHPNLAFLSPKTDYEEIKNEDGAVLYESKLQKYSIVKNGEERAPEDGSADE